MCVVALPGVSLFFLLKRRAHICTAETCMEFVFSPQCRKSINEAFLPLLLFLFVSFTGRADLGRSTQLQGAVEASPGEVTFSRGCPCLRVNPVGSAGHGCLLWLHVSAAYFGCTFQLRILAACFSCVFWLPPTCSSHDGMGHLVAEPRWRDTCSNWLRTPQRKSRAHLV